MKKRIVLAGIAGLLLLTGCGHNTVSYGDGVMLETTINPESYAFGVSFRYGKILTACVRENVELEMQGGGKGAGGKGEPAAAESSGSVKLKIGSQTTGYTVDAIKARIEKNAVKQYSK